jgi:hypothetical protein
MLHVKRSQGTLMCLPHQFISGDPGICSKVTLLEHSHSQPHNAGLCVKPRSLSSAPVSSLYAGL